MKRLHKKLHKKMQKKGWEDHHIQKTLRILKHAEENKHPGIKLMDEIMVWAALFLVIMGNFITSLALIPLLLTMPIHITIVVVFFFGICFGALIDIVVRDIDKITGHHYIIAGIFIPLVSVLNIILISNIMKIVSRTITPAQSYNPLLIVIVYIICFSVPHVMYKIMETYNLEIYTS